MKSGIVLLVLSLFIYSTNSDPFFSRIRRVWDGIESRLSHERRTDYQSPMDDSYRYASRPNNEREREEEDKDEGFDPTVVIVDKPAHSPSPPEKFWPERGIFDGLFGIGRRRKAWWQGPNVCVERKEINEGSPANNSFVFSFTHSSCEETETAYICTKKIRNNEESKSYVEKRQCCYGYKLNGNKCEEFELQGLVPTMKNLGATRFVKMLSSVDLLEKFKTDNFTVFCPVNDAIADFEDDDESNIIVARVHRHANLATTIAGHIVDGYLRSGDITNNQRLLSTNEETTVLINVYYGFSGRVFTANCARIIKADNYATNGVVHLVDRMLAMPSKTVGDIISSDPQLSFLKGLLSKANMVQKLRDPMGNFTVFAPTDAAFKNGKIDSVLLQKLQDGKACVASVVQNHVVPHVICTSAISVAAQVRNLIDNKLNMKRNDDDKLFVNGAQLISHDIVGTNGVVHIIDEVLVPEEAQTVTQALQSAQMTEVLDLIEKAGMQEELDNMKNYTFFVPKPSVMKDLMTVMADEFEKEPNKARELIKFHLTPTKIKSCEFHNNQLLPTEFDDTSLRINKYETFPRLDNKVTVQCATIISDNNDICEGTVHVIDRVLSPAESNVLETLKGIEGLSTFVRLINESGLAEKLEEEGPFTILAPTDEAFGKMHNKNILENKEELQSLLKTHILPEMLCCSGVERSGLFLRQYVTTLEGSIFGVHRAHYGVKFSNAKTLECDHVATNGVIHILNRVIEPRRQISMLMSMSDIFDLM